MWKETQPIDTECDNYKDLKEKTLLDFYNEEKMHEVISISTRENPFFFLQMKSKCN